MIPLLRFKGIVEGEKQDLTENFYLYKVVSQGRTFRSLICTINLEELKKGQLLKHEEIFPEKILSLCKAFSVDQIQYNPVLILTDETDFQNQLEQLFDSPFLLTETVDAKGSTHSLLKPKNAPESLFLSNSLCVADGHHRLSALLHFSPAIMSAVMYSSEVVTRDHGVVFEEMPSLFWDNLHHYFEIKPSQDTTFKSENEFHVFIDQIWYLAKLKSPSETQQKLLSIELFREYIFKKILKKTCSSTLLENCTRSSIEQRAQKQNSIGFVVPAASPEKVLLAAREGRILEANSTYFEPKFMNKLIGYRFT